jgi:formate hydrogenlyase transcriptional activator
MKPQADQYEALLRVSQAISSNRDMRSLMDALAERLHSVVQFDYFDIVLYDAAERRMQFIFWDISPELDDQITLDDGPGGWVCTNQKALICSIEELKLRYPKPALSRERDKVQSICVVPLTTAQRRLGCLEFLSVRQNAYSEDDAHFIEQVASQIAVAVDNTLNHEAAVLSERRLQLERDRLATLLRVTKALGAKRDINGILENVSHALYESFGVEYICIQVHSPDSDMLRAFALDARTDRKLAYSETSIPIDESPWARAFTKRERIVAGAGELKAIASQFPYLSEMLVQGIEAACFLPLQIHSRCIGVLAVSHRDMGAFNGQNLLLLDGIAEQLAIAVENTLAYQEISQLRDRLASEKLYLEEEIRTEHNFKEIIGESVALNKLLSEVELVASSDSTALILGETGTGKELIARAIHQLSARRDRTLVKLNCAAIPLGLLESELFGHERGAFTGAVTQKIGRLELAHKGTLFLDEVGEIPLELQPKLLRAIQEREIERLGGTQVIRVDVRIIAATNRELKQMVTDHQFRSDLYYRLNVFPLRVPPLRQRQTDIPLLVRYFTQKHARRMKRNIDCIPAETMKILCLYSWPGNVRELENLIERAVILSKGPALDVPLLEITEEPDFYNNSWSSEKLSVRKPQKTEIDLIKRTLQETNGIISGPGGAAARLGLKRSTLISRMKKLGL